MPLQLVEEYSGVRASTNLVTDDDTTIPSGDGELVERQHGGFSVIRNPLANGRSRFLTDSMGRRRESSKSVPLYLI